MDSTATIDIAATSQIPVCHGESRPRKRRLQYMLTTGAARLVYCSENNKEACSILANTIVEL